VYWKALTILQLATSGRQYASSVVPVDQSPVGQSPVATLLISHPSASRQPLLASHPSASRQSAPLSHPSASRQSSLSVPVGQSSAAPRQSPIGQSSQSPVGQSSCPVLVSTRRPVVSRSLSVPVGQSSAAPCQYPSASRQSLVVSHPSVSCLPVDSSVLRATCSQNPQKS
jgi:hypothetical protein